MEKKRLFYLMNVLLPLASGGVLYVLFRPSCIFWQAVSAAWDLHPVAIALPRTVWGDFLHYYICDMLWAYAFAAAVSRIIGNGLLENVISSAVCILFFFAVEFCQKIGVLIGTFDVWDVLLEGVAAGAALSIINIKVRRDKHEKQMGKGT